MSEERSISGTAGIVVIGRNEGERLERCLASLSSSAGRLVYVDSGSRDASVAFARGLGMDVLELDMRTPFTAARARNEGFQRLLQLQPDLTYVFFVDGDCEVVDGWLGQATRFLDSHPDVAVVWGRRRERYPERSVYNLLCDIEWDSSPVGETRACGGDAVMRVAAFRQVNGFLAELICGEEPELCARLRQRRWRIWHLALDMTIHDAAIYHFAQWWKRMMRVGYGYAMFRKVDSVSSDPRWVERCRQSWLWGCGFPAAILALSVGLSWQALWLLAVYPLQVLRLGIRGNRSARENWVRAMALVLGKFPEVCGQLKFILDRRRSVRTSLIEYK